MTTIVRRTDVGVVYLVVRTHEGSGAGADGIGKGPKVKLMHGNVVDVGRN